MTSDMWKWHLRYSKWNLLNDCLYARSLQRQLGPANDKTCPGRKSQSCLCVGVQEVCSSSDFIQTETSRRAEASIGDELEEM